MSTNKQKMILQNECAIERAKYIKTLTDTYGDTSIDDLNAIILKAAVATTDVDVLHDYFNSEHWRVIYELNLNKTQQQHAINQDLKQLEALKQEVETLDISVLNKRIQLEQNKNKLKKIKTQGDADIEVMRVMNINKIEELKQNKLRQTSEKVSGFIKGFNDITTEDITSIDKATKLSLKKFVKTKIDYTAKLWSKVASLLIKFSTKIQYTEEQRQKTADLIIKEITNNTTRTK